MDRKVVVKTRTRNLIRASIMKLHSVLLSNPNLETQSMPTTCTDKSYTWREMMVRGWSRRLAAKYLGADPLVEHRSLHSRRWDGELIDAIEARIRPELAAVIEKRETLRREERRSWERKVEIGTILNRIKGYKDMQRFVEVLRREINRTADTSVEYDHQAA